MATLAERMKAVTEAEKAAGVHYTQTGAGTTPGIYPGISPGQPAIYKKPPPEPELEPEPEPFMPEMVTLPDGSIGYFDPSGNWVQIQGPDPFVFPEFPAMPGFPDLEQYAPQPTTYEPLTQRDFMLWLAEAMRGQVDPTTGESIYTSEQINTELMRVANHINAYGFGAQTPYYGAAQQYYANIAGVEASFNTAGMSASDYMDFQLAIMQMVNNQNIAQFQAQVEQTMWGAQLQLSQQQLATQLQIAMMPYQQMTVWQQAQLEQAAAGDPNAQDQLALDRELGRLPYEQMTAYQQAQIDLALAQTEDELAFARERLDFERQTAMMPYEAMTASERAQLELAQLPYQEMTMWQQEQAELQQQEMALAQQQLALQEQAMWMPYQGMTAAEQAQMELAQMPYEQMTAYQQAQTGLQEQEMELARERMALEEQLAMLPYQGMSAYQQAQVEQQILQREAEIDLIHQQLAQQMQLAQLPYQGMTAWQQEQAGFQQQQLAQELQMAQLPYEGMTAYQEAMMQQEQQNYLANLRAQPRSWLEYSAAAGETPAIQPWMQPLMPQEYQQLGAGQAIPGYQGIEGMAGMPALTTPSRQYQARMGPTATEQYYGYQQAQTGAPAEETQWRLWSQAPPAGRFGGLGYTR